MVEKTQYKPHTNNSQLSDTPTNEPRRWWVGLDFLPCVLLDNVPKLPYEFGVKDVKWLSWVSPAMLDIWSKKVVIRLLIPLKQNKKNSN